MEESLKFESEKLARSWMQHDKSMLRDYLVSQVEDPRINVQSILTRHFLANNLLRNRFQEIQAAELCFAVAANWLWRVLQKYSAPEDAEAILHALSRGADEANGIELPLYLARLYQNLPIAIGHGNIVPNYLENTLRQAMANGGEGAVTEETRNVFLKIWQKSLQRCRPKPVSVLEPACGSANDYRFIDAFGFGRLLRYSGFDLCEKNVANAKELFPGVEFQMGNVFEINAPDKSYDLCIVHDLFEHLSPQGLEASIAELCRVTRRAMCVGFFNMAEEPEHRIQPVDDYHWNRLSMERTKELFLRHAKNVQVLHIGTYLDAGLPGAETHNENAYTFVVDLA